MFGEKVFCGLDIGSQRVKASLIKAQKGQSELLGVNESLTKGLKKSSVNDLGELADCIHYCLKGLMKKTTVKLKDVRLGIGGNLIESRFSNAIMPLIDKGNKIITIRDVKKIDKQTCLLGVNIEEEVLHEFPQNYVVDDNNSVTNPIGLCGRKLGVNFLLIISKVNLVSNIVKAVNQAGYEASRIAFSSLLACEASLNKKIKTKGCILIDIGSSTTDVLIIKDGLLRELDVINLGGDNVTMSLSKALDLPFGLSEEIKKSYAAAKDDDSRHGEEILVKKETGYTPIERKTVCESIEPEIVKLVRRIENTIKRSRRYDEIESGIIMVGGGSLLPGLIERVQEVTHLPVHIGKVNIARNRLNNPAVFSAAVGLAQGNQSILLGHTLLAGNRATLLNQFNNKVKEWYQEYF